MILWFRFGLDCGFGSHICWFALFLKRGKRRMRPHTWLSGVWGLWTEGSSDRAIERPTNPAANPAPILHSRPTPSPKSVRCGRTPTTNLVWPQQSPTRRQQRTHTNYPMVRYPAPFRNVHGSDNQLSNRCEFRKYETRKPKFSIAFLWHYNAAIMRAPYSRPYLHHTHNTVRTLRRCKRDAISPPNSHC